MPPAPAIKPTVVFVDGPNPFHSAREAFDYSYPNYDGSALAREICMRQGLQLDQVRF
jgi:hypothetical protein